MTEGVSISMRLVLAAALLLWVTPAWAQTQQPPVSDKYQYQGQHDMQQVPARLTLAEQIVSLKEYIYQIISERDRQYAQRFEAQQKAVDAALVAQDKATSAAFAAAKEAVAAALAAQERATNAAFTAANSAVTKAEMANEKRLDNVNEFRGQLKDQAAGFVTRAELIATVVGFGGLIIGMITLFTRIKIGG